MYALVQQEYFKNLKKYDPQYFVQEGCNQFTVQ